MDENTNLSEHDLHTCEANPQDCVFQHDPAEPDVGLPEHTYCTTHSEEN